MPLSIQGKNTLLHHSYTLPVFRERGPVVPLPSSVTLMRLVQGNVTHMSVVRGEGGTAGGTGGSLIDRGQELGKLKTKNKI